ncbi:MAG TPA: hypothetical protein VFE62_21250 [Gemmataceae bacterium]|nr:hypothetical protein [Gemmataceae bacterium]
MLAWYGRRLRIWETNYGRDCGWIIERQGSPIAILTEPRWEKMFWDSYRMEIVADDQEYRARMLTTEFWANAEAEGLVWRNRELGEVAEFAFPALAPFPEPGRLMVRGLYLSVGEPWPWDWLVMRIRRWRKPDRRSND